MDNVAFGSSAENYQRNKGKMKLYTFAPIGASEQPPPLDTPSASISTRACGRSWTACTCLLLIAQLYQVASSFSFGF